MRQFRKKRTNAISALYDEAHLPYGIRRALNWIMTGNTFGALFTIICGGGTTAMVGLAGHLGAGDLELGILAAIPQVAMLLQLPFSMLVNRTHKRKIYLLTIGLISRFIWMFFGLLPLLSQTFFSPLHVLFVLLTISSVGAAMINVCWFPWFSDIAPLSIRGRWLSIRESVLSAASLIFGIIVAYLLDILPEEIKYICVFLFGGIVGTLDMICFGFAPEVWYGDSCEKSHVRETFKEAFNNKPFMKLILMWTVWSFTSNLSGTYYIPYAMNCMGLSFMQVTLFGTVASSVATMLIVPRWGKALDRFGSRNVMMVGCVGASLAPVFYLFSTQGNIWPMFLYSTIGAVFWSASNLAANSMQLSSSPEKNRPTYIALYSCITSLIGTALGTMCGGWFLELCLEKGWFMGLFDRYKVLILLSIVLRFISTLFLVPRLTNDHDGSVKDVIRAFLPHK